MTQELPMGFGCFYTLQEFWFVLAGFSSGAVVSSFDPFHCLVQGLMFVMFLSLPESPSIRYIVSVICLKSSIEICSFHIRY